MKKIIILIACLAIVSGASAQRKSIDIKKFTLGVKAGLNVSKMAGKDVKEDGFGAKPGFHVGIAGEFKASKLFVIAPEIIFSTQGAMRKDHAGEATLKTSINSNYINIPVMARFYVIDALSFEVGPQFGFALGINNKAKITGAGASDGSITEKVDSKNYNTFDFGIGLGATYNLNHKFFASVRYNFGLTNVVKYHENPKNRNGVFQLSVGYNFFRL